MREHNFGKCLTVITSEYDTSSEKFLIFVLSELKVNDLAAVITKTSKFVKTAIDSALISVFLENLVLMERLKSHINYK